jgi:hypothetical protein
MYFNWASSSRLHALVNRFGSVRSRVDAFEPVLARCVPIAALAPVEDVWRAPRSTHNFPHASEVLVSERINTEPGVELTREIPHSVITFVIATARLSEGGLRVAVLAGTEVRYLSNIIVRVAARLDRDWRIARCSLSELSLVIAVVRGNDFCAELTPIAFPFLKDVGGPAARLLLNIGMTGSTLRALVRAIAVGSSSGCGSRGAELAPVTVLGLLRVGRVAARKVRHRLVLGGALCALASSVARLRGGGDGCIRCILAVGAVFVASVTGVGADEQKRQRQRGSGGGGRHDAGAAVCPKLSAA